MFLLLLFRAKRTSEKLGRDARDPDPGCLDGQNFVYPAIFVQAGKLFSHFPEKSHVHLMVEKGIDLEYAPLGHNAVPADALFQKLHRTLLLCGNDTLILPAPDGDFNSRKHRKFDGISHSDLYTMPKKRSAPEKSERTANSQSCA